MRRSARIEDRLIVCDRLLDSAGGQGAADQAAS